MFSVAILYNSVLNRIQRKSHFLELSFESFLILLSNEMDLSSICVTTEEFPHLLSLVKSLMNRNSSEEELLLSEQIFDSEFDCLLVNECLELALFSGKRLNSRLLEKKAKFAAILFDFGFSSNARKYCQQMRRLAPKLNSFAEKVCLEIESRFHDNSETTRVEERAIEEREEEREPEVEVEEEAVETTTQAVVAPNDTPMTHQFSNFNQSFNASFPPITQPPVPQMESTPPEEPLLPPLAQPLVPNGDIPFSFVSSSQSLPSMPFNSNEFFENGFQSEPQLEDHVNRNQTTEQRLSSDDRTTALDSTTTTTEKSSNKTNNSFLSKLLPFNFKRKSLILSPLIP